ncbi:MAG: ATP-binding cassette domain-containing protein, partial [Myxococcota bacterium]|nr:ATP-binding cassette domain-containing protein [Myxococcota bacterium]
YSRFSGDLANRLSLAEQIGALLSGSIAQPFFNLISIFFFGVVILFYSPLLALIGLGIAGLNILAYIKFSQNYQEKNFVLIKEQGLLDGISVDGLMMIETIQASAGDDDFFSRWSSQYQRTANVEHQTGLIGAQMAIIPGFLNQINALAILCIGGIQVMQGNMTIGTLIGFQALMGAFMAPFMQLLRFGESIQQATGSFKRVDDVIKHPTEKSTKTRTKKAGHSKLRGELCVKDLNFGFSKLGDPFIKNMNLQVRPGEHIAFVGASGSGKSTAIKLLAGLYQPWAGQILFDGKTKETIPDSVFQNSLNMVEQEIFLFAGSILDNLTLWNPKIPKESIYAATKDAMINQTIMQRPQGYNTLLDEGGENFSGGERQRLEIARALTTEPSFLLLDEATSALDAQTEEQLMHRIRQRHLTCVFAAHRLNTIRYADRIFVFDAGSIVEEGTHKTLLNQNGYYTRLVGQQGA